ncbi:MAG: PEP-CTERM sorting domain-containing protein [Crocosphaera sp.]|nr:PEP-CTERM sorting domain-containing protein [Crocosphaera sp.]
MTIFNPPKFVTRSLIGAVGLSAIAFFGVAESANALTVVSGSDFWRTEKGSMFDFGTPIGEVEFIGRPLGNWTPPTPEDADPIYVGNADTIVRRYDNVTFNTDAQDGESGVSDVELVALSLISKDSVDLGGSLFNILVDLNPEGDSTGTIIIREDGTYSSDFAVSFLPTFRPLNGGDDISCENFLNSTQCDSFSLQLTADGEWSREPSGIIVEGLVGDINANLHTDLSADQSDFFPVGVVEHLHENYANPAHIVREATPEPLTILGSATALGFGTFFKRKLGKKRQPNKA